MFISNDIHCTYALCTLLLVLTQEEDLNSHVLVSGELDDSLLAPRMKQGS